MAVLLIIVMGLLIIAIKTKSTPENSHHWVFYCGAVLGLTGGSMALYYGIYKGDSVISILSASAFIAMAVLRIVGMESAVHAWQNGRHNIAILGIAGALLCWTFIYAAGSFEGQADAAAKAETAAAATPAATAIDAQIAAATARLSTLGNYADGSHAAQSVRATDSLADELKAAQKRLEACNSMAVSKCVTPRTADVMQLENELKKAKGYGIGNSDYLAATALLADLQNRKAALIANGASFGKVGKDIEFIAAVIGTTDKAHASRVLWLLYVGFMDVLSTIAHLFGALIKPRVGSDDYINGQFIRQVDTLLKTGFSQAEVFNLMHARAAPSRIGLMNQPMQADIEPSKATTEPVQEALQNKTAQLHTPIESMGVENSTYTPIDSMGVENKVSLGVEIKKFVCKNCSNTVERSHHLQLYCHPCQEERRQLKNGQFKGLAKA